MDVLRRWVAGMQMHNIDNMRNWQGERAVELVMNTERLMI